MMKRIVGVLVNTWRSADYTGRKIYILLALIGLIAVAILFIKLAEGI